MRDRALGTFPSNPEGNLASFRNTYLRKSAIMYRKNTYSDLRIAKDHIINEIEITPNTIALPYMPKNMKINRQIAETIPTTTHSTKVRRSRDLLFI